MANESTQPQPPAPKPSIEERIQAIRAPVIEAPPEPEKEPEVEEAAPVEDKAAEPSEDAPEKEPEPEKAAAEAKLTPDDEEAAEVSTLHDLARYLELDDADLYSLSFPIQTGTGEAESITLGQIKDELQSARKLSKEQKAVAEAKQSLEQERAQHQEAFNSRLAELAAVQEIAEKQLMADMEQIDWAGLRSEDPTEWVAKRQEFSEKQAQLQAARQQMQDKFKQMQAEAEEKHKAANEEYLARERDALLQALPEWRDQERATAEKSALRTYLEGVGFTQPEIAGAVDHRMVVLARKAMLYDQASKEAKAAVKRVVKIGKKTIRPGTTRQRQSAQEDRIAALKRNLKKSGSTNDAAALIRARMNTR